MCDKHTGGQSRALLSAQLTELPPCLLGPRAVITVRMSMSRPSPCRCPPGQPMMWGSVQTAKPQRRWATVGSLQEAARGKGRSPVSSTGVPTDAHPEPPGRLSATPVFSASGRVAQLTKAPARPPPTLSQGSGRLCEQDDSGAGRGSNLAPPSTRSVTLTGGPSLPRPVFSRLWDGVTLGPAAQY